MKFNIMESSIDFKGNYAYIRKLIVAQQSLNHKRGFTELRECLISIVNKKLNLNESAANYEIHHKDRNESNNIYTNLVLVPKIGVHDSIHRQCIEAAVEDFFYRSEFNYINNYKLSDSDLNLIKNNISTIYDNYIDYMIYKFPYSLSGCFDMQYVI